MERITLMSLLFTVVVGSSLRQYLFVNQKMNWTEAQRYCREKHTDLVTINDTNKQNQIKQLLNSVSGCVWIGLKDTWIWFLSDPGFYRENETQYRNWGSDQPNGDGDCVFMDNNGQWNDANCGNKKHFICYNVSTGLVFVQEDKNWSDAQKYCREHHTDLVSVRNQSENDQIKNMISYQVWIGVQRSWLWSDNSIFTFRNWAPNEPNLRDGRNSICTATNYNRNGGWTDEHCTELYPFVCYDDKVVLIQEKKTWPEALRYCRDKDMNLVSVDSEEIQRQVMNKISGASTNHVWLGLRHSCTLGIWFWVNGNTICYDQWASDYNTGLNDCDKTLRSGAFRTNDSHWISRPETEENYFICSKLE